MAAENTGMREDTEEKGELTVEETFQEIEKRVKLLESSDVSLEDAFRAYREGMALVRDCDSSIAKIEKKVMQIAEDGTLSEFQ